MLRLEELIAFIKVIEHKSFSRAAKELGLSQPAVSLQVKSLEAEYGAELLHREGVETVPTEQGKAIYQYACQIISLYQESQQRLLELEGEFGGKLSLGASSGPAEHLLPLLMGIFKKRHPQVEISLRVGDSSEIIDHVLMHRLEVGFVGISRRDRNLAFEPFIHDQLILVASPGHPLSSRESIDPDELEQVPLMLQQHGSGARTALYQSLADHSMDIRQLNVVMELGLQESTKAAVRAGLGATFISRLGVIEELERGILVEVPIDGLELNRDYFIVSRKSSPLTTTAKAFVAFAQDTAGEAVEQIRSGFVA
ncbi:MAG: selenium metabolism-associated LysR family transcriptional regulator [Anaerolineales bacterium]|jgi:DNA-binding transcriptional LysR family regulator